ncbi:MAG: hypothetical protein AAFP77_29885 [Bacteroidota bacterium]
MLRPIHLVSILLAGILIVGFVLSNNNQESESTTDATPTSPVEEPSPAPEGTLASLPAVALDSVYAWNDTLFDWVAQRLINPEEDLQKPILVATSTGQDRPPTIVDWEILTNIEYRSEYFAEMDMEMYAPIFSDKLKALDGRLIEITGYVIPVVDDGREIALSANPYAACFFCGKASPASVMSVQFDKPKRKLRTDDYRTVRGRLKLNYDDPNQFYYILKDAQLINS